MISTGDKNSLLKAYNDLQKQHNILRKRSVRDKKLIERLFSLEHFLSNIPKGTSYTPHTLGADTSMLENNANLSGFFIQDMAQKTIAPGSGIANIEQQHQKSIGIICFGLQQGELEKIVRKIVKLQSQRRDFSPVFLLDKGNPAMCRRLRFAYEMLPLFDKRVTPDYEKWQQFCIERLEHIDRKWNILGYMDFTETV